MSHLLHAELGQLLQHIDWPEGCRLFRAPECGGSHNLPLFCSHEKSYGTEYCNPDALVLKNGKIRLLVEIEESGLTPTKVCGKFLTSALSKDFIHCRHGENGAPMGDRVTFIQLINTFKLPVGTNKTKQGRALERSIQSVLPLGKITEYRLFTFRGVAQFRSDQPQIEDLRGVILAACRDSHQAVTANPSRTLGAVISQAESTHRQGGRVTFVREPDNHRSVSTKT